MSNLALAVIVGIGRSDVVIRVPTSKSFLSKWEIVEILDWYSRTYAIDRVDVTYRGDVPCLEYEPSPTVGGPQ
jgi:hypothetical protein